MTKSLVGIGGHFASGKDTVADNLVSEYGWEKLNMSDPLVKALVTLNPIVEYRRVKRWHLHKAEIHFADLLEQEGYVEAKKHTEFRRLLQKFGSDVARDLFGKDVWVNIAKKRIRELWAKGSKVVITGIRFPNELDMIRDLKGHSVWIERPGLERKEGKDHQSETGVAQKDFDETVMNDEGLLTLYVKTGLRELAWARDNDK